MTDDNSKLQNTTAASRFVESIRIRIAEKPGDLALPLVHNEPLSSDATSSLLREANQKLKLHFERTPMGVIEWDRDFRVSRWNPAAQKMFGYSQAEAFGQHACFIVPEKISRPRQSWFA